MSDTSRRAWLVRWTLLAACAYVMWVAPIRSGLSLDETSTSWVVSGTWHETIGRAIRYQGQSPLYYLIVRAFTAVLGLNELSLRLPSVLATALTAHLVFRIGRRLWDTEVGYLSAVAFVSTAEICYAACDARPYALGVLAATASTLALIDWADTGRLASGLLYAVLATSIVYVHYFFGSTYFVHGLYLWARIRSGRPIPGARSLAAVALAGLLCLAPLLPQMSALYGRHAQIEYSPPASWNAFAGSLVPLVTIPVLAIGLCLLALGRLSWLVFRPSPAGRAALALAAGWHVVPRATILFVSRYVVRVFLPRYHLNAAPGCALLLGWLLSSLPTSRARSVAAGLILAGSTVLNTSRFHALEDWRMTADWARKAVQATVKRFPAEPAERIPVLMNVGFIESMQLDWLEGDPERRSFLLAPVSLYPIPGELVPLPRSIVDEETKLVGPATPTTRGYVERVLARATAHDRFLVVTQGPHGESTPLWPWLLGRLSGQGFVAHYVADTDWYLVFVFERRPR